MNRKEFLVERITKLLYQYGMSISDFGSKGKLTVKNKRAMINELKVFGCTDAETTAIMKNITGEK